MADRLLAHQGQRRTDALYGAVLLPTEAFARLSVSEVLHEARAAALLANRLFDDEAAAAEWLAQLP